MRVKPISAAGSHRAAVTGGLSDTTASPVRPLSEYLTAVTQRNPFTGRGAGVEVASQAATQTARHQLEESANGLSVVGIDRGANPVALVEEKAQQKTFVVKVGDEINGLRVVRIGPEGVVVSYEGEETLLR